MYNDSIETLRQRMIQQQQEQQLFHNPKPKSHYGFEYEAEAKKLNRLVKFYIILVVLVAINFCLWFTI